MPRELRKAFEARVPAVRLVTFEEPEVRDLVLEVASAMNLEPWIWSTTTGIRRGVVDSPPIPDTQNAAAALHCMRTQATEPSLFITLDLADHLDEKVACRALKELIEHLRSGIAVGRYGQPAGRCSRLAMIDHRETVPDVIASLTTRHLIPSPNDDEVEELIRKSIQRAHRDKPVKVDITKRDLRSIVQNLRGLSRRQVEGVIHEAVAHDRAFDASDIPRILAAKKRLVRSAGVLEFVEAPTSLDDIGGLSALKHWLSERRELFTGGDPSDPAPLDAPRGVMLLGVQGAGKSLAAKAIATAWKRPLMRLDPGALFNSYIGESERRLREALTQAEAMSPVVLWIDEIEKGFASAASTSTSTDGGLSRRMFGTLLTWMQEHTHPVFLVATANDIEALPPELLRKGRFDEIFFVDLPREAARKTIFEIHLKKRKQDPTYFNLDELVQASHGFSGAEIEQAVIAALTSARAIKRPMTTADLIKTLETSPPLSVTMAEKVTALRHWALGRCVPAD